MFPHRGKEKKKNYFVAIPPETQPLFPPHIVSYPSTPVRCPLSPSGHHIHIAYAQHPGTLDETQLVLQSPPA